MKFTNACRLLGAFALVGAPAFAQSTSDTPAMPPPSATSTAPVAPVAPAPAAAAVSAAPGPVQSSAAQPPAAATSAPAAPAATASATPPAAAQATGSIPAPPPGKSQVVFFRPSGFSGMAVWFNVRENGVALGKLTNGAYFVKVTDPGPHTYTAATENHNVLKLELDDGETQYIKGSVQMGFVVGEAAMTPSDQATFEKALKHMHLAAPPAASPDARAEAASTTSPSAEPGR